MVAAKLSTTINLKTSEKRKQTKYKCETSGNKMPPKAPSSPKAYRGTSSGNKSKQTQLKYMKG